MEKSPPVPSISQLESKIKRQEAVKEILNRAVDITDDMFNTDIRKNYLPLLEASVKQG